LLDATFKNRGTEADRITLGMLAGWDIAGTIRHGSIFIAMVSPARDVATWLDFALERPFGRSVLLDPDAETIAIAPALLPEGNALGAVVTTYALFDSPDHDADTNRAFERANQARHAQGRPALARLPHDPWLDEQSRRVLTGATEPGAALHASMAALATQNVGARVHGYLVETNDIRRAPVPDAVLNAPGGSLSVVVTHHRVKGAAWGQYVIFYLLVPPAVDPGTSASTSNPAGDPAGT
jgi:hypothetical protein